MIEEGKMRLPELLAPAGSIEHLKAAILAGADAVYMGGQRFSARAYADNFTTEHMLEALRYAHFYGRRLYLTVNTLIKEKEFGALYEFLAPYYEAGLDGVIVQDLGTASFIRKNFEKMEVHASTQLSIMDVSGAMPAKDLGITRVVPARELSLKEIREIREKSGLEVEVFIHGALCYCYSGQCLFSSTYGGRSGNRGRCAQPCRMSYELLTADGTLHGPEKRSHLLSPKDLCSLSNLEELCLSGVDSLKIEGRMKNIEYVTGVTEIYRKHLDAIGRYWAGRELPTFTKDDFVPEYTLSHKKDLDKDQKILEELYCREGFTDGYFHQHNGNDMMAMEYPKNLGRRIGKVTRCRKFDIEIELEAGLSPKLVPKDLLVIPETSQKETVLTVPNDISSGRRLSMRLPKGSHVRVGMDVYRRRSEELLAHLKKDILEAKPTCEVTAKVEIFEGRPAKLTLSYQPDSAEITSEQDQTDSKKLAHGQSECAKSNPAILVEIEGQVPEHSENRPVTKEDVLRQLKKTGNVPFVLKSCEIALGQGLFYPMSWLKDLRQNGYALLQERMEHRFDRRLPEKNSEIRAEDTLAKEEAYQMDSIQGRAGLEKAPESAWQKAVNAPLCKLATVYNDDQLDVLLCETFFDKIVLSGDFYTPKEATRRLARIETAGKKAYYALPRVWRERSEKELADYRSLFDQKALEGIYIYHVNEAQLVKECGLFESGDASLDRQASAVTRESAKKQLIFASSMNQWNKESMVIQRRLFGEHVTELSYELSREECLPLLDKGQEYELMVFGRNPIMTSTQCVKASTRSCNHRRETLSIVDEKGRHLPVSTHCQSCYNLIWRDLPRNLIGEDLTELVAYVRRLRFDCFGLSKQEIQHAMDAYRAWEKAGFCPLKKKETDAHWESGVE